MTDDPSDPAGADPRPKRAAPVLDAFERNYAQVQYHYVQFLTEHLADCARTFSGDLTKVLVLAVLGVVYFFFKLFTFDFNYLFIFSRYRYELRC